MLLFLDCSSETCPYCFQVEHYEIELWTHTVEVILLFFHIFSSLIELFNDVAQRLLNNFRRLMATWITTSFHLISPLLLFSRNRAATF